jgi:hypothetical protein
MLVAVDGVTYSVRRAESGFEVAREHDSVDVGSFAIGEDGTITYQGWFVHEVSAQTLKDIAEAFRERLQRGDAGPITPVSSPAHSAGEHEREDAGQVEAPEPASRFAPPSTPAPLSEIPSTARSRTS